MKFNIAAIACLLPIAALAAPIEERAAEAAPPQWTIQNMKRVCNSADTSCAYSFGINTHLAPPTPCSFTVTGPNASRIKKTTGHVCGGFTVGTGWVNKFGNNNGFTVLPTYENGKGLQAYPSYSDADLNTNQVVKPNRSFDVQKV